MQNIKSTIVTLNKKTTDSYIVPTQKAKQTRKLCYRKDDCAMCLIKLLPVSILTKQSDNTHMVCCWKVPLYHLVPIAGLYGQK